MLWLELEVTIAQVVTDYLLTIITPNSFQKSVSNLRWALYLKRRPQVSERQPDHLSNKQAEAHALVDAWINTVIKEAFDVHDLNEYIAASGKV